MSLAEIRQRVVDKSNFIGLGNYVSFARHFATFVDSGLQATIISQNESNYRFFQYKADGHFNITRPLNGNILIGSQTFDLEFSEFFESLLKLRAREMPPHRARQNMVRCIYTLQQCIGAALDALPVGESNRARKINGDLFERLMCLIVQEVGVDCVAGTVKVPILDENGLELFRSSYQHDMLIRSSGELKAIGSVKTSSKDRIDKVFMDKFLYNRLTETEIPHIAIFLNDVQRKRQNEGRYGVNATFLANHFKAYTLRLNPLDGVYYCDIRPNMRSDAMLSSHIATIDKLFFDDLLKFCESEGVDGAEVEVNTEVIPE